MSPSDHAVVVSPAGPIATDVLNPGLDTLHSLRVPVYWPDERWREDVHRRQGYLAGSDEDRATQLKRAVELSPRGVWMARGGYGCIRTLDRAAGLFEGQPVPLWGFSDGTALLAAWCRANWPAWHAPPLSQLPRLDPDSARRVGIAWHEGEVAP
ncbi:MAG: LD-carboxypeptidase, partial [Myxococcota bacterium]|nr:LD-carboxypeptidase [Myxococcota bacterium]